jgi:hypothetical protein
MAVILILLFSAYIFGVNIPDGSIYVGDDGTDSNLCGIDTSNLCKTLDHAYSRYSGEKKHVCIFKENTISVELKMQGGYDATSYSIYGIITDDGSFPKLILTSDFHIYAGRDSSWFIALCENIFFYFRYNINFVFPIKGRDGNGDFYSIEGTSTS